MLILLCILTVNYSYKTIKPRIGSRDGSANGIQNNNEAGGEQRVEPADPADSPMVKGEMIFGDNYGVINKTVADVYRFASRESERVTQCLFNQPVEILEQTGEWAMVKVVDGYTGWILNDCIDMDCSSIQQCNYEFKIVISGMTKKIYDSPNGQDVLTDVTIGTQLYSAHKQADWYEVALPEGKIGWIDGNGTIETAADSDIETKTAADFVATLNSFIGTKYLWGGVSPYGADCSGLTYICGRVNGIDLPRDAQPQFLYIKQSVNKGDLKTGDLVFFNSEKDLNSISHVGVYIGEDHFIHASKSAGKVVISSTKSDYFQKRFAGARRIF